MTFHVVKGRDEAREVAKLARELFGFGSRLKLPDQSKWAIYARDSNGELAGGVILRRLGRSVGMVDFIFVHEWGRGQGLQPRERDEAARLAWRIRA